jgi:hypothetical protein
MLSSNAEETKMLQGGKDYMEIIFLGSKTIARKNKTIKKYIFPAQTVSHCCPTQVFEALDSPITNFHSLLVEYFIIYHL